MPPGLTWPSSLTGEPQQPLHHRPREEFGIGDPRLQTDFEASGYPLGVAPEQVVCGHMESGREGDQEV